MLFFIFPEEGWFGRRNIALKLTLTPRCIDLSFKRISFRNTTNRLRALAKILASVAYWIFEQSGPCSLVSLETPRFLGLYCKLRHHVKLKWKKHGACFSKVPKLFGRISGDIILFVSSKRRRFEARNFAVIFIFIPFTTY